MARGPGAESLVRFRGAGGAKTPEAECFFRILNVHRKPPICLIADIWQIYLNRTVKEMFILSSSHITVLLKREM